MSALIVEFPIYIENKSRFHDFVQKMAYRAVQGRLRYGPPNRRKRYLKRLKKEIKAYEETGNMEHLINAAVYCHLETCEPENRKFHFDNTVESATRGKI